MIGTTCASAIFCGPSERLPEGNTRKRKSAVNDKQAKRLRSLVRRLPHTEPLAYQWNKRTGVMRVHPACRRGVYLKLKGAVNANRY